MERRKIQLILGGLFHDIGKVLYRYDDGRNHSASGYDYVKEKNSGLNDKEILDQIRFHHAKELRGAELDDDSLAYITYWADNVASEADRRSKDEESDYGAYDKYDKYVPLETPFNILNSSGAAKQKYTYAMQEVYDDGSINYPDDTEKAYSEDTYGEIIKNLNECIASLSPDEKYINSALGVLEANLSYVPSSTDKTQFVDISLFDHMKITAAIGSCMYDYLSENGINDYKEALLKNSKTYYSKKSFLMMSMDISGIQSFLYLVESEKALKSLRSKSFYLEIMLEHIVDELLERLELSRANLIYSGGGHAYLLLPNTDRAKSTIDEFDSEAREWFIDNFGIDLYVAMGYRTCSANELMNKGDTDGGITENRTPYASIFKDLSTIISKKKTQRYSAENIIKLNTASKEAHSRECRVCGRVDRLTTGDICEFCDDFKELSDGILNDGFITVLSKPDEKKKCIRLPFDYYMLTEEEAELRKRIEGDETYVRSYSKNKLYTGNNMSTRLWVGDYVASSSFENLAESARGVKKLGVLRGDVDNLGQAFVAGFPAEYTSLSRAASFSRKMNMFFKLHINHILANGEYTLLAETDIRDRGKRRNVAVVYSGGDDVFVVGAWNEIIETGIDLVEAFRKYTQGKLTLSAGIGMFPKKYPVKAMARQTEELESASKDMPGKDAVSLFGGENMINKHRENENSSGIGATGEYIYDNTYKWKTFREKVLGEKYGFIEEYFSNMPEKGMSALYKLMGYIRSLDDSINLARLAYMLGRIEAEMEDGEAPGSDRNEKHAKFASGLYDWISNDENGENKRQLITAIYIYAYLHRESMEG